MSKELEALDRIFDGMSNNIGYIKYFETIRQGLVELERLKEFKQTFDNYELSKKQDFITYENWQECEKELKELKAIAAHYFSLALKRDSKWSTGLSKDEEKEILDIEYKIIKMLSENQL